MSDLTFTSPAPEAEEKAWVLFNGTLREVQPDSVIKDIARDLCGGRGQVSLFKVRQINDGGTWQNVSGYGYPGKTMAEAGFTALTVADIVDTLEVQVSVKGS